MILSLNVELEQQLSATTATAYKLRDKTKHLKGAVKRSKYPESKARARDNYKRVSNLYEEALEQMRWLRGLIEDGRDNGADALDNTECDWRHASFFEHREVNVDYDSWVRQSLDLREAAKWLEDLEANPPEIDLDMAHRLGDSMIARKREHERELFRDLLVSTKALTADYDALVKKNDRQLRQIGTLDRRSKKLEASLAATKASRAAGFSRLNRDLTFGKAALGTTLDELDDSRSKLKDRVDDGDEMEAEIAALQAQATTLQARVIVLQAFQNKHSGPNYEIVLRNNEGLTKDLQRLTRENARLVEHIDRLSGR